MPILDEPIIYAWYGRSLGNVELYSVLLSLLCVAFIKADCLKDASQLKGKIRWKIISYNCINLVINIVKLIIIVIYNNIFFISINEPMLPKTGKQQYHHSNN